MPSEEHSGDSFGHSLTDLMTSIAIIFILFFLVFVQSKQEDFDEQEKETLTNRDMIFEELDRKFLDDSHVAVRKHRTDPLTLEIVLTDHRDALGFEKNKHRVASAGRGFLEGFIPSLTEIVCKPENERLLDSIIVEGHTDSDGDDDSNTKLSALRATAVVVRALDVLSDEGPALNCFLRLAQAAGRGEQEPVTVEERSAALDCPNGRGTEIIAHTAQDGSISLEDACASRRVVVKVRVKSIEQRDSNETAEGSTRG